MGLSVLDHLFIELDWSLTTDAAAAAEEVAAKEKAAEKGEGGEAPPLVRHNARELSFGGASPYLFVRNRLVRFDYSEATIPSLTPSEGGGASSSSCLFGIRLPPSRSIAAALAAAAASPINANKGDRQLNRHITACFSQQQRAPQNPLQQQQQRRRRWRKSSRLFARRSPAVKAAAAMAAAAAKAAGVPKGSTLKKGNPGGYFRYYQDPAFPAAGLGPSDDDKLDDSDADESDNDSNEEEDDWRSFSAFGPSGDASTAPSPLFAASAQAAASGRGGRRRREQAAAPAP